MTLRGGRPQKTKQNKTKGKKELYEVKIGGDAAELSPRMSNRVTQQGARSVRVIKNAFPGADSKADETSD